jgi:uncharacterized membrane protein
VCTQESEPTVSHRHPANQARHDQRNFGQRAADSVATAFGSWRFIIVQTSILALWVVLNSLAWVEHWDGYPFVFMNLLMSLQSAYAAPLILLSQNRAAEHDRLKAEHDYVTNERCLRLVHRLASELLEREVLEAIEEAGEPVD